MGRETVTTSLRRRELAGDVRAGSWARAKARRAQRDFVRERWLLLLIGWLIIVAPTAIAWWFVPGEFLKGLVIGGALVGASALVWSTVVHSTGTGPVMMGDQTEQWTAQELRKLKAWRLVNHFALGQGDMDHVVIGPAGVLVVETKWTAEAWDSTYGVGRQRDAAGQVTKVTRQLSAWHDVKSARVPVRPVVVLWGGATRKWPVEDHVRTVDGVPVVVGHALADWLRGLPAVDVPDGAVDRVWGALDAHTRRREDRDPGLTAVPMSLWDLLAQLGWFVLGALAGTVSLTQALSLTDSASLAALAGVVVVALAVVVRRLRGVRAFATGVVVAAGLLTSVLVGVMLLEALL